MSSSNCLVDTSIIDLCDSSSDDSLADDLENLSSQINSLSLVSLKKKETQKINSEATKAAILPTKKQAAVRPTNLTRRQVTVPCSWDDDDDSRSSNSSSSSWLLVDAARRYPQPSKTIPATTAINKLPFSTVGGPQRRLVSLDGFSDSSDEEDDPLLFYHSGFTKKKITPTTTATTRKTDTVELKPKDLDMHNKSATTISAEDNRHSRTGTTKKSDRNEPVKVAIVNPYASSSIKSAAAIAAAAAIATVASEDSDELLTYPRLGVHSKLHPDLRAKYLLAFWKYSQTLVHNSYDGRKLDAYCKRINHLALSAEFPIRSFQEYTQRFAKTTTDLVGLQAALQAGGVDQYSTTAHFNRDTNTTTSNIRYNSIAEACLDAMLSHVEQSIQYCQDCVSGDDDDDKQLVQSILQDKESWLSLSALIPNIDARLRTNVCPGRLTRVMDADHGAAHYTTPSTKSSEYKQLEKLTNNTGVQYLKPHKQNKQVYYELTTLGYQMARRIRRRAASVPAALGHYRCSNLSKEQVQPKYQGMFLAVDYREGGGAQHGMYHRMCQTLDRIRIPYFVASLSIGDYCFFTDTNKLLPILVERKTIQDVAASIADGRWKNQKHRMYQGQYVFGYYDNENNNNYSRMVYIIEGNEQAQEVTGGYIGNSNYNVSRERLDQEIAHLENEGFEVIRTCSPENSMFELSRLAARIRQEYYQQGKLQADYTYEEFLRKVSNIPKQTDFSRIAKNRMMERRSVQNAATDGKEEASAATTMIVDDEEEDSKDRISRDVKPTFYSLGKKTTTKNIEVVAKKEEKQTKVDKDLDSLYKTWSVARLQKQCVEWGLPKSGSKAVLLARVQGPRPPQIWLQRKAQKEYVPSRHDTCATALLVGIYLEQLKFGGGSSNDWEGLSKDELYVLAEGLQISKDPFSGGDSTSSSGSSGPYRYDGWSCMKQLLGPGDPPLVVRLKGGQYKLTTSYDAAGYPLAEAMHKWCHEHNQCSCRELGYDD